MSTVSTGKPVNNKGHWAWASLALALIGAASWVPAEAQETAMDAAVCPAAVSLDTPEARRWRESLLTPGAAFVPLDLATLPTQLDRKSGDYPGLCRYAADNSALTRPPRVVLMGDSITEAWVAADPDLFGGDIVGRGISAQTSGQMLSRFYADVIALRPKIVHIMAGTNDIAGNMGPTSEQTYKNNIMMMVDVAHRHGIKVLIASIPPADHFWWAPAWQPAKRIQALNAWLKSYARSSGSGYVDYYTALADKAGAMDSRYANDGVHPNRAGYAVMRGLVMRALAQP